MSNYVLDHAFHVEEANGIERHRLVAIGDQAGGCKYPAVENAPAAIGITTHSQTRQNKAIAARMAGIAPCEAAGAIAAGSPVAATGTEGKIKRAIGATTTTGSAGSGNALNYVMRVPGMAGNGFELLLTTGANGSPLSHAVNGRNIIVTLATDGGGTILTTAAQIVSYIAQDSELSRLIEASHAAGSSGSGLIDIDSEGTFAGGEEGVNIVGIALQTAQAGGDVIDVLLTL